VNSSPLFCSTNQHYQIQPTTYCLPYIRHPKMPNHYTFTLKMATAMFAETLDDSRHLTQLIPETRSYALNLNHIKYKFHYDILKVQAL
jgi:hypothetical protein